MCGIAGLFLPGGGLPTAAAMSAMLDCMGHRGPDGQGRHDSPDGRFRAGFVRLSIIDIATGGQPIVDDEVVLLGNGEIYNYLELRAECVGRAWRTEGDMEAALALYRRKGEQFVQALNGMYGLALYDGAAGRLLLVRDRLGVKPVYWARLAGGGLIFASEIKALFASGFVQPEVDEEAVTGYLAHGYVAAPSTLYRGVFKLPAGHLLRAHSDGRVEVERYWQPISGPAIRCEGEAIERLTALLDDSVRLQLRSDVPVGALLSGGIDSGLLVALAARQLDRPLNTYTVRFAGAPVDESPLAAEVAARYDTRHTCFDLDAASILDHFPRLAWYCDEPLSDASLLPNQLIEDVLGREVRVALNGTGGDELFAGYGRYFQLPIERRFLSLPPMLRRLIRGAADLVDPMLAWRLGRAEAFVTDRGRYLHDHSTLFPAPMLRLIGHAGQSPRPAQAAWFSEFNGSAESAALYADIQTYLVEDLLTLLDRSSMAASVEGRVPFLDHRLVETALTVDPMVRAPHGRQKALERAMAAPFLPASVLNAPKQGFASPVSAWMRQGLGDCARRLLTRPRSLERGWWTRDGVERLLADPDRHGPRVYALCKLELVVRLHVEQRFDSAPTGSLAEVADG